MLYAIGMVHPSALDWGFNFFGFFSPYWFAVYLVLTAAALFVLRRASRSFLEPAATAIDAHPGIWVGTILLLFVGAAFLFRIHAPLFGDSFTLIKNFTDALSGISPLAPWHEPLSIAVLYYAVRSLGSLEYPHIAFSFLFVQIVLGAGFIVVTFFIVRLLFVSPVQRVLVFGLLLVIPYMEYFFGYIETYSVSTFALSVFVLCSLLVLRRKISFAVLPLCFLGVMFSHYINGLLGVSLVYLAILEYRRGHYRALAVGFGGSAAALIIVLWAVNFVPSALIDESPISHFLSLTWNVSLYNQYSQAYTVFSLYHFIDLGNYLILMAPYPLVLAAVLLFRRRKEMSFTDPDHLWFLCAIIPLGVYLLLAKLEQGTANDWDVFAAQFLLLALYVSTLYVRHGPPAGEGMFLSIVCLTLINSSAWFAANAGERSGVERFTRLWDKRILSQLGRYTMALRLTRYYAAEHDSLRGIEVWERYTRDYPGDPRGYANTVGDLEALAPGDFSRRLRAYEGWMRIDPENDSLRRAYVDACVDAGNNRFNAGRLEEARVFYEKALARDSMLSRAYNNLGSVYAEEGDLGRAVGLFEKAVSIDSAYGDATYNLGAALLDRHERRRGIDLLRRAARLGVPRAKDLLDSLKAGP